MRSSRARHPVARRGARSTTPVPQCCARTNRSVSKAGSSPACRSRGASPSPTTTWAAITSSGPAISSRPPAASSRSARIRRPGGCCGICRSPRKPMAIGRRTCGSTARRTGTAFRWTKPRCPFCWSISPRVRACSTQRERDALLADGAASGRVSGAQWSGQSAGSLGRRAWLFAVHDRDRNCRAARRRRSGRRARRTRPAADYLRETADAWNASIERWLYVSGTELGAAARRRRILRARRGARSRRMPRRRVTGSSRSRTGLPDQATGPAALMVSLDALAFVRFGLRAADDPRIVNTVKVIDATLKSRDAARARVASLSGGRVRRTRRRRAVRRHRHRSRVAAPDRRARPLRARRRTHATSPNGWRRRWRHWRATAACCPSRSGTAPTFLTGSCSSGTRQGRRRPLVWAHAEYLKLCRSLRDGEIFDRPPQTGSALSRRTG